MCRSNQSHPTFPVLLNAHDVPIWRLLALYNLKNLTSWAITVLDDFIAGTGELTGFFGFAFESIALVSVLPTTKGL